MFKRPLDIILWTALAGAVCILSFVQSSTTMTLFSIVGLAVATRLVYIIAASKWKNMDTWQLAGILLFIWGILSASICVVTYALKSDRYQHPENSFKPIPNGSIVSFTAKTDDWVNLPGMSLSTIFVKAGTYKVTALKYDKWNRCYSIGYEIAPGVFITSRVQPEEIHQ